MSTLAQAAPAATVEVTKQSALGQGPTPATPPSSEPENIIGTEQKQLLSAPNSLDEEVSATKADEVAAKPSGDQEPHVDDVEPASQHPAQPAEATINELNDAANGDVPSSSEQKEESHHGGLGKPLTDDVKEPSVGAKRKSSQQASVADEADEKTVELEGNPEPEGKKAKGANGEAQPGKGQGMQKGKKPRKLPLSVGKTDRKTRSQGSV